MASSRILAVLLLIAVMALSGAQAMNATTILPSSVYQTSGYEIYRFNVPQVNGMTTFYVEGCTDSFTVSVNAYLSDFYQLNGTVSSTNSSSSEDAAFSVSVDTNYASVWEVSVAGCTPTSVYGEGNQCFTNQIGPACVAPETVNDFPVVNTVTVYRLPAISTLSTYSVNVDIDATVQDGNTLQVSDVFYNSIPTSIVFGESFTSNVTNTTVATISNPVIGNGYYYIAFTSSSNTSASFVTVHMNTMDCSDANTTQIYNPELEECEDIALLTTRYNFTTYEFKSSYMFGDDDDYVYFQLDVGSSLQFGLAPSDDDGDGVIPDVYIKYGNIPSADDYDFMASTGADTLFYESGDLSVGVWYLALYSSDASDLNDEFIMWFKTACPNECNDLGDCSSSHVCQCSDNWTGYACNVFVPNGEDPDDVENNDTDWWDVSEWGAPAWIAVSLLVLLIIIVIVQLVVIGFIGFKWRQERSRYQSY